MLKDLFKEMFEGKENNEVKEKLVGDELLAAIRDAIAAEYGAVKQYMSVHDNTDEVLVKTIMKSVADEELVHVGEFNNLLMKMSPYDKQLADKGNKEADDKLSKPIPKEPEIIDVEMKENWRTNEATHGEVPFDTFDKKLDANFECKLNQAIEESRMTTYTTKIMSEISIPGLKRISVYTVADGTVGLFRYEDGNAYEIEIRPASLAKRKDVWGNLLKKREDRVALGEDTKE